MKETSLSGKRAIVTGGGGGLGSVVVRRFLDEGIKVAITSRTMKDLDVFTDSIRRQILVLQADVTGDSEVQRVFEQTRKEFGAVEIVVNTVGGFLPRKPITEVTTDEWDRMMNINLKSTFLCTREALRGMQSQRYGRIINISAMGGLIPSAGRSAYAVAKSAVSLLTEIAGMEHKGTGITVNAIAPSIIDTEANRRSMPGEDYRGWVKPERLADVICYLCSEDARDVTGTTIRATGGV